MEIRVQAQLTHVKGDWLARSREWGLAGGENLNQMLSMDCQGR